MDLGNEIIKNSKLWKYLGIIISKNEDSNDEINSTVDQTNQAIKQIDEILWSKKITETTKIYI